MDSNIVGKFLEPGMSPHAADLFYSPNSVF